VKINIQADTHLYNLDYPLTILFTVRLDGNVVYTGSTPTFILDTLPIEDTYSFTVQGTYNGRNSSISPAYRLPSTDHTLPGEQVIEDMISVLGQQVTQQGQDIKSQIDDVSSRIDVDVVQVLHHADDGTVDIKEKLLLINNRTLVDIQTKQASLQTSITNIDNRLSAKTVSDIQGRLNDISDKFNKLSQQLDNQTATIIAQKPSVSSSGSGVSGAGIAIGIIVGIVIGVIGALVSKRVFQRLAGGVNGGYARTHNALMSPGMSLVDEE
jgi:ElaB/YqjD/DUF883 family membrane-anchored ribosome-binding protein